MFWWRSWLVVVASVSLLCALGILAGLDWGVVAATAVIPLAIFGRFRWLVRREIRKARSGSEPPEAAAPARPDQGAD